ncbi:MAG: ribonuclease HII [Anaerolineae bacterium]|jgi:ribonuclease HII|nr:ribonuclease HII [Anaerolineae bacterium]
MPSAKRRDQTASLRHEAILALHGCQYIFGLDEAGRGPWAGPLAAAAVALPVQQPDLAQRLKGVRDSKQMTPRQRLALVDSIKAVALAWGIGSASVDEINTHGLSVALDRAMQRALAAALAGQPFQPQHLLLDHVRWHSMAHVPQSHITGGDRHSLSIAAASVLAKTWRDEQMLRLHEALPQYGFDRHKGYGTPAHRAALEQYGISAAHRRTYKPIAALLAQSTPPPP